MKSLVIGIDESEEALDALRLGRLLAAETGAGLDVVAVLPGGLPGAAFESRDEEREAAEYFEHLFEVAADELDCEFTPHRLIGLSPPAGLTRSALETDASAIVIGSSCHGPIGRVLMGDVGARLASGSQCPVVVAPRGYSREPLEGLRSIGVGYNGSPESAIALSYSEGLATMLGASIMLIGAVPVIHAGGRIGHTGRGYQRLITEQIEASLVDAVERSSLDLASEVRSGDAADCLAEASQELALLVLGSRGYGPLLRVMLGGVSLKAMRSSACPVIVVPRGPDPD